MAVLALPAIPGSTRCDAPRAYAPRSPGGISLQPWLRRCRNILHNWSLIVLLAAKCECCFVGELVETTLSSCGFIVRGFGACGASRLELPDNRTIGLGKIVVGEFCDRHPANGLMVVEDKVA